MGDTKWRCCNLLLPPLLWRRPLLLLVTLAWTLRWTTLFRSEVMKAVWKPSQLRDDTAAAAAARVASSSGSRSGSSGRADAAGSSAAAAAFQQGSLECWRRMSQR